MWLRFQGGKGVATYIGVLIGLHWPAALVFCMVWIGAALRGATRRSPRSPAPLAVVLYYLLLG